MMQTLSDNTSVKVVAMLPKGDYASPDLKLVLPDDAFPNMIAGTTASSQWPYLRREISHNWYVDRRNPTVGFLSRDEALIVYNLALGFQGLPCLEIGCWRGWSTVHIALGAGNLEVVDPVLGDPDFRQDVADNLRRAGVLDRIVLHPGSSPAEVDRLSRESGKRWSFVFIDGDHDGEAPRLDAEVVHSYSSEDAMIVLHDLASPDVAAALSWLRAHGWDTYIYQTMQIMGVAVRGTARPIAHLPDPSQHWTLPSHLASFPVIGEGRRERLHRIVAAIEGRLPSAPGAQSSCSSLDSLPQEDARALDTLLAYVPSALYQTDLVCAFDALQSKHLELQGRFADLESIHKNIRGELARVQRESAAAAAARQDALYELTALSKLFELLQSKYLDLLKKLSNTELTHQTLIQQVSEARREAAAAASAHQTLIQQVSEARREAAAAASAHCEVLNLLQKNTDSVRTHHALIARVEEVRREADAAAAAHAIEDHLRDAIRSFAFWMASKRILFGLSRRLVTGRTQEVCRIIEQMLRDHGIPHNLTPSAMWLARPRVVFGLARRRVLSDMTSVQGLVALALERSLGLLPDSAVATPLLSGTAALQLMQARLSEMLRWLEHGAPMPDSNELQHLRNLVGELQERIATAQRRLAVLEETKLVDEKAVSELREEIATTQRRYAALEEAKIADEKALLEADLTIARLRKTGDGSSG
jgi:hypothetical protein